MLMQIINIYYRDLSHDLWAIFQLCSFNKMKNITYKHYAHMLRGRTLYQLYDFKITFALQIQVDTIS